MLRQRSCAATVLPDIQGDSRYRERGLEMTNYEKIKAMSVEEMSERFGHHNLCGHIRYELRKFCLENKTCDGCIEKWLLQEGRGMNNGDLISSVPCM